MEPLKIHLLNHSYWNTQARKPLLEAQNHYKFHQEPCSIEIQAKKNTCPYNLK